MRKVEFYPLCFRDRLVLEELAAIIRRDCRYMVGIGREP